MIEYPGTEEINLNNLKMEAWSSEPDYSWKSNQSRQIVLPTFENTPYRKTFFNPSEIELEFFTTKKIAFSNLLEDDYFFKIEEIDGHQFLFIFEKKSLEVIGDIELKHIFKIEDYNFFTAIFDGKILRISYHRNGEVSFYQTFEKVDDTTFALVNIKKTIFDDFIGEYNRGRALILGCVFILGDGRIYQCCKDTGLILRVFYFDGVPIKNFDFYLRSSEVKIKVDNFKFSIPVLSEERTLSAKIYKEYLILRELYINLLEEYQKLIHDEEENLPLLMVGSVLVEDTLRLYRVLSK